MDIFAEDFEVAKQFKRPASAVQVRSALIDQDESWDEGDLTDEDSFLIDKEGEEDKLGIFSPNLQTQSSSNTLQSKPTTDLKWPANPPPRTFTPVRDRAIPNHLPTNGRPTAFTDMPLILHIRFPLQGSTSTDTTSQSFFVERVSSEITLAQISTTIRKYMELPVRNLGHIFYARIVAWGKTECHAWCLNPKGATINSVAMFEQIGPEEDQWREWLQWAADECYGKGVSGNIGVEVHPGRR